MSDNEGTAAQGTREDEQRLDGEIEKGVNKLKYFLGEADELIQLKDYRIYSIKRPTSNKRPPRISSHPLGRKS